MEKTKTAFIETFGESPTTKVLDFFLTFGDFDYSKTQVAKEIEISRITIEPVWSKLIEMGLLERTRLVGRAEMYKLNKSNQMVKELLGLNLKLGTAFANEELSDKKIIAKVR